MKIDRFELHIINNNIDDHRGISQKYCLAGQEIKGRVEISVRERLRVARLSLRLIGISHTDWCDSNNVEYESNELFLDEYKDLTSDLSIFCNETMEILWGDHQIHFALKLPMESISSIKKDGFGYVKYTLIATLDVPEDGGDSEVVAECEIPVHAFLSLDSPHFLNPVQASDQFFVITRPWLCFIRNPPRCIRASLSAPSMGILPGETSIIIFTVENNIKKAPPKKHAGNEHQCSLISLCQQIDFRSRSKINPQDWSERSITTAVKSYGICKANTKIGPETRMIHFEIPSDLPPTTTRINGLISWNYFFRLEVQEQLQIILPIVIGSHKTMEEIVINNNAL